MWAGRCSEGRVDDHQPVTESDRAFVISSTRNTGVGNPGAHIGFEVAHIPRKGRYFIKG
jgi:hypothetical protein